MRNKLFLTIAASLVSASLYATDVTLPTMDANGEAQITKDEFHGNISDAGIYSRFDTDQDGELTKAEFNETGLDEGLYDGWDVNQDDRLDDIEFSDGTFANYDENEDGHWNNGERDDAGEAGFWEF